MMRVLFLLCLLLTGFAIAEEVETVQLRRAGLVLSVPVPYTFSCAEPLAAAFDCPAGMAIRFYDVTGAGGKPVGGLPKHEYRDFEVVREEPQTIGPFQGTLLSLQPRSKRETFRQMRVFSFPAHGRRWAMVLRWVKGDAEALGVLQSLDKTTDTTQAISFEELTAAYARESKHLDRWCKESYRLIALIRKERYEEAHKGLTLLLRELAGRLVRPESRALLERLRPYQAATRDRVRMTDDLTGFFSVLNQPAKLGLSFSACKALWPKLKWAPSGEKQSRANWSTGTITAHHSKEELYRVALVLQMPAAELDVALQNMARAVRLLEALRFSHESGVAAWLAKAIAAGRKTTVEKVQQGLKVSVTVYGATEQVVVTVETE